MTKSFALISLCTTRALCAPHSFIDRISLLLLVCIASYDVTSTFFRCPRGVWRWQERRVGSKISPLISGFAILLHHTAATKGWEKRMRMFVDIFIHLESRVVEDTLGDDGESDAISEASCNEQKKIKTSHQSETSSFVLYQLCSVVVVKILENVFLYSIMRHLFVFFSCSFLSQ